MYIYMFWHKIICTCIKWYLIYNWLVFNISKFRMSIHLFSWGVWRFRDLPPVSGRTGDPHTCALLPFALLCLGFLSKSDCENKSLIFQFLIHKTAIFPCVRCKLSLIFITITGERWLYGKKIAAIQDRSGKMSSWNDERRKRGRFLWVVTTRGDEYESVLKGECKWAFRTESKGQIWVLVTLQTSISCGRHFLEGMVSKAIWGHI